MRLASTKFHKGQLCKAVFGDDGLAYHVLHTRYSYETKGALYDVDVRKSNGYHTYHVNCGPNGAQRPIHRAIKRHFGI